MWYVLYSLIILSSILVLPVSESYWMPKDMAFIVLGMVLIGSSWLTRKGRTIFYSPWLSIMLIYFAILFGWFFLKPLTFPNARGETLWNFWTFISSINVFLGILLIYTLIEYTDSYKRWIDVAKVICWLGFGLSIYAILQYFKLDQIFQYTKRLHANSVVLFFGNPMLAGHFLAMISPLCLIFRKLKYFGIYILMAIAIILTRSEGALGIFGIGFVLFLIMTGRWKISLILIFLGIVGLVYVFKFYPEATDLTRRFALWKGVIEFSKEAPFTGHGLGFFLTREFHPLGQDSWAHVPHNTFLLIWHDTGLIGLGLVLCYLAHLFWRLLFVEKSMLLIGFMIAFINWLLISQIGFPMSIAPMALMGILYIACLEVHCSITRGV